MIEEHQKERGLPSIPSVSRNPAANQPNPNALGSAPVTIDFCCPVCRAKQELNASCRRCAADLTLVVKARQRLAYLHSLPLTPDVRVEIASLSPSISP